MKATPQAPNRHDLAGGDGREGKTVEGRAEGLLAGRRAVEVAPGGRPRADDDWLLLATADPAFWIK